jgi:hypothetical protein
MTAARVDIVVGLPTRDEAGTVKKVAEACSAGLREHFAKSRALLVNADNDSRDGTREAFLSARTSQEKLYVNSGGTGKGRNVRRILEVARERGAGRIAIVDGDLHGITPAWMERLLSPLEEFDYVTPYYRRQKYDGNCTNHVCYPLLYTLTGRQIRQPIGGEFAFSRSFLDHLLRRPWNQYADRYGIDIFMTATAVLGGFRICQARLPPKEHRSRDVRHSTRVMRQVIASLFQVIDAKRAAFDTLDRRGDPPVVGEEGSGPPPAREPLEEDVYAKREFEHCVGTLRRHLATSTTEAVEDCYAGMQVRLDPGTWSRALLELASAYSRSGRDELVAIGAAALNLGRVVTFHREASRLSEEEAEAQVRDQATLMAANRHMLAWPPA